MENFWFHNMKILKISFQNMYTCIGQILKMKKLGVFQIGGYPSQNGQRAKTVYCYLKDTMILTDFGVNSDISWKKHVSMPWFCFFIWYFSKIQHILWEWMGFKWQKPEKCGCGSTQDLMPWQGQFQRNLPGFCSNHGITHIFQSSVILSIMNRFSKVSCHFLQNHLAFQN